MKFLWNIFIQFPNGRILYLGKISISIVKNLVYIIFTYEILIFIIFPKEMLPLYKYLNQKDF